MKNRILFLLFIMYNVPIFAQTELIVELIFEDAAGRQDTTFVGISDFACDASLNQELGEKYISPEIPDSLIFKAIGAKTKQEDGVYDFNIFMSNMFSKYIFFGFAQDNGFQCLSAFQAIVFKCRLNDFPLTIRWNWVNQNSIYDFFKNSAKFNNKLILFTGEDGSMVIQDYDSPLGIRLQERDSIRFQKEELMPWPGTDNDYVLVFYLQQVFVSTENISRNIPEIKAFPNPASTDIRLEMEGVCDNCTVQFYDINGVLLKSRHWQNENIDVTILPKGIITGLITNNGIPTALFRFIKAY